MTNAKMLWVCVVVSPLLCYLFRTMCVWESPRALGHLAFALLSVDAVFVLPILFAPFAAVYCAVKAILYRKAGSQVKQYLLSGMGWSCLFVLLIFAVLKGNSARYQTFARATESGTDIVQALREYRDAKGQYPDRLEELVPKYLNSIPYTGLIAYPEFRYTKDRNDLEVRPGHYELRINCSSGGINFDRFVYWPSETYPDRIQGNGISRVGAWAYLHE